MNNNSSIPTPRHGDKQTTLDGNFLVCVHAPGSQRKFFYVTPEGIYKPHPFTVRNKQFLTKTEWNYLYTHTQKVERLTDNELVMVEELVPYIVQDVTQEWDLKKIKEGINKIKEQPKNNSFGSIPGFANILQSFT